MSKLVLRQRLKSLLKTKSEDKEKWCIDSRALSKNLREVLLELIELNNMKVNKDLNQQSTIIVGIFAPLEDEPQLLPFNETEFDVKWGSKIKFALAFPKYESEGKMAFYQCHENELILDKGFGVSLMVPPIKANKVRPHILIIPGLGFGLKGERLGRGKGYYDRYLEDFKGPKIGVCFETQLMAEVPTDKHDVLMDIVVTEKRVLRI